MADTLTALAHKQLAIWEALRRLGFEADDIFVGVVDNDGRIAQRGEVKTVLRPADQPGTQFVVNFPGSPKVDKDAYERVWKVEATRWKDAMTHEERDLIYRINVTEEVLLNLVVAIGTKGIKVPELPAANKLPRTDN